MRGMEAGPTVLALSPPGSPERERESLCVCVHVSVRVCVRERMALFAFIPQNEKKGPTSQVCVTLSRIHPSLHLSFSPGPV